MWRKNLPLPAGEGRGEGEGFDNAVWTNPSKAVPEADDSPSPFIALPLGEGNRRRTFTEIFAAIVRSDLIVLRMQTERGFERQTNRERFRLPDGSRVVFWPSSRSVWFMGFYPCPSGFNRGKHPLPCLT